MLLELEELLELAELWIEQDPEAASQISLQELMKQAETDSEVKAQLTDCFAGSLQFGTAGLRGALGPGPNRMNRVTVLRAAAGLGAYLLEEGQVGKPIVIGYDGRHHSEQFAIDSAEVFAGLGFRAYLFETVIPTPVLAFSIRELKACAGVMVTASHNPATDNGYKVYLADGRQIIPPADIAIAKQISLVGDVRKIPMSNVIQSVPDEILDGYVKRAAQIVSEGPVAATNRKEVRCIYTAMHGVGWNTFSQAVGAAGFAEPISVVEQQEPNPDFPTVKFPNPEEPGAMDLAFETGTAMSGEIIVANDPDADRLAIAIPNQSGRWQMLRGDQVGILLAWWIIKRHKLLGKPLSGTFANSIVSCTQISSIAKSAGLDFTATLTGFKWVSRVPNLVYGYEEALGYCVDPESVSDKDGISAALVFLELFAYFKSVQQTIWQVLDEISTNFGLHETAQVSVRISSASDVKSAMSKLREIGQGTIGPFSVLKYEDLELGDKLPPTDGLIFELAPFGEISWSRIIVRPSGTEPKIKCYLEVKCNASDLITAKESCHQALVQLADFVKPLLTGGSK